MFEDSEEIRELQDNPVDLSPLPFFEPYSDPSSIVPGWKLWKRRLEMYIAALGICDPTRERALQLYQFGPATHDIFDTISGTGSADNYTTFSSRKKAVSCGIRR